VIALGDLVELNEADLRLDRVKHLIDEIDDELGDAPWLEALQTEMEEQKTLVDEIATRRASAESDLDDRRQKIESEDGKLYDGSITESRELRNQQEAVYALRRGVKEAEEPALALMEAEELQREASTYLTTLLAAAQKSWGTAQAALKSNRATLAKEAASLETDVTSWRGEIPAADLAIYDKQRVTRPLAIAAVAGGVCGACRLALPTTILTRARRRTEPVFCPTCACILYVP